jgi:hypothetical protein
MNMKGIFISAAALVAAGAAHADTLDLAQFLPAESSYASPLAGTTLGGVSYTITSPNGGFTSFNENPNSYSGPWFGIFAPNAPVLWDGTYSSEGPGSITVTFATPITSLSEYAMSNDYGTFNETMTAFDGVTSVDSVTINGLTAALAPGTATLMSVSASAITSVVIGTTNDGAGFAISDSAIPEPSTWAMLLLGFAGYRSTRKADSIAA